MADPAAATQMAEDQTVPADLPDMEGDAAPKCIKCQSPLLPDQMVLKHLSFGPHKRPLCKSCHSVSCMIQRNFDGMPDGWECLSTEETVDFYKKMLQHKNEGPLRFAALRTEIKNTLVSRQLEETRRGYQGEFHPLSYWEKKGYDTDMIKLKAEKMIHPVLGDCFRVDIFHVSSESIAQKVEEAIRCVDRTVKRKRIPKAKAKGSAKKKKGEKEDVEEPAEVDQDLVDLIDLESDVSVEEVIPKGLTTKQLEAQKRREAKKKAKELEKDSKKITNSKALTSMKPLQARLQNIKKGLRVGEIEAMTQDNLDKKIELVEAVVNESLQVMKAGVA